MAAKIDINADMGESYGRWTLGHDADLMPFLSSANIACGYHGGDPHVMRTTVRLAKKHGVAIGAHVSFPDLIGFGRRRMDVSPQELKDYVTYQVGALQGFATAEGARVEHVKPHGMLYVMCSQDRTYAESMAETVKELTAGSFCCSPARSGGPRPHRSESPSGWRGYWTSTATDQARSSSSGPRTPRT